MVLLTQLFKFNPFEWTMAEVLANIPITFLSLALGMIAGRYALNNINGLVHHHAFGKEITWAGLTFSITTGLIVGAIAHVTTIYFF